MGAGGLLPVRADPWADPWLAPGDATLRHDPQWLADEGVLTAPTTTWPLARDEIELAVRAVDDRQAAALPPGLAEALARVRRTAESGVETRLAGAEPSPLRGFADSPRESGEASAGVTGSAGRYSAGLQLTVVADAADGQTLRADGSYASAKFGNVAVTAGLREQWWGPGWEGSLILSTDARPMAVYGQFIGEDEAGGLPSKFLGLMGVEAWGGNAHGSWRAHAEYTDTTCSFSRQRPQVDCAYRNSVYPQGYMHRGRMIGHSMDNDSRMLAVGAIWVRPSGQSWSALARRVDLNRYGGTPDTSHALASAPRRVDDLQLGWRQPLGAGAGNLGTLRVGVGAFNSEACGFVEWRRGA